MRYMSDAEGAVAPYGHAHVSMFRACPWSLLHLCSYKQASSRHKHHLG